jgi:hypothetical protein
MMQQEDTLPWYRQFWPWFVILLPATAVVASLYTLSIAMRSEDSLVVDAGRSISAATEQALAAENRARDLGLSASVAVDLQSGAVSATLDSAAALQLPAAMQLMFSHPAYATRDVALTLNRAMPDADGNEQWVGHLVQVPKGRWYVVLQADNDWRLNGTWSGEDQMTLRAASDDGD